MIRKIVRFRLGIGAEPLGYRQTAERSKERKELGLVPGGLFAKWTTDRETFEADFLDAHLSDEALRGFIFHLAALSEIARELDPTTKFGDEHAAREHAIAFYADRLCLTPNHLGSVIREVSGQTVMQWIHRHIIQQAKLQLKYSDLPVWQIAESLNFPNPSFFSKFFKRETGMTPAEYRNR